VLFIQCLADRFVGYNIAFFNCIEYIVRMKREGKHEEGIKVWKWADVACPVTGVERLKNTTKIHIHYIQ
jgi:hypothetical protein